MEKMEFDVVIIGGGVAGLSASIRLKQLSSDISICLLEKSAEIGGHILSGAVFDPIALNELLPDWRESDNPLKIEAKSDEFLYLSEHNSYRLPTPPSMKMHGNYIISLGELCRFLGRKAEKLGVQIFAGFPAKQAIIEDGSVCGVLTQEFGVAENGEHKDTYQPSLEIRGKTTIFAEGCRGHISEQLIDEFDLRADVDPQTYGLGIKEIWEVTNSEAGKITHIIGYPLDNSTYGGSFIYHLDGKIAIGFVMGLDYKNPYLDPYEEFQKLKMHPKIRPLLEGGKRIEYGARTLNEGGLQSIPKLSFNGGYLIGCAAGFLNVPRIKGSHTAMKSGMLVAEAIISNTEFTIKNSFIYDELYLARNIRPAFKYGLWAGIAYAAFDVYILHCNAPWTFHHKIKDREFTGLAKDYKKISYPKYDEIVSFSRLDSLPFSATGHTENQPKHLKLADKNIPIDMNLAKYDAPEQRYCPAGVYEILDNPDGSKYLQINSQNCLHCKCCDIKDMTKNIRWVVPEGGGGANYSAM